MDVTSPRDDDCDASGVVDAYPSSWFGSTRGAKDDFSLPSGLTWACTTLAAEGAGFGDVVRRFRKSQEADILSATVDRGLLGFDAIAYLVRGCDAPTVANCTGLGTLASYALRAEFDISQDAVGTEYALVIDGRGIGSGPKTGSFLLTVDLEGE